MSVPSRRPYQITLAAKVPQAQRDALEEIALREGVPMSEIIRSMVRRIVAEGSLAFLYGPSTPRPAPAE